MLFPWGRCYSRRNLVVVNFSDQDMRRLRKDIERVREYEKHRLPKEGPEPEMEGTPAMPAGDPNQLHSVPLLTRLRQLFETFVGPPEPSEESLERIPESIVTLLQVIREDRKLGDWFQVLEALPPSHRSEQIEKMSAAFRHEGGDPADAFECLQNPAFFRAFCRALRDERKST
jgi:hypothetical protein